MKNDLSLDGICVLEVPEGATHEEIEAAERASRYEWALQEYSRIMEKKLNPGDYLTTMPLDTPRVVHKPDPQSKLFARLLSGKKPLVHAPPKIFSDPWYALIDDEFSDDVTISGFDPLYKKTGGVKINECPWIIRSCNEAGRELMDFDGVLENRRRPVLTPDESKWALSILFKGPEYLVQHGANPVFKLKMTRVNRRGRRDLLFNGLLQRDYSGGDPEFVKTIAPITAARASTFAKSRQIAMAESNELVDRINRMENEEQFQHEQTEWVMVTCLGWILEQVD